MFEDIGHSKDARTLMTKWIIGQLKGGVSTSSSSSSSSQTTTKEKPAEIKSSGGLNPLVVLVLLIAIALGLYFSQK